MSDIYITPVSPTPRQVGRRIRALRQGAGLKQSDVAKRAKITREYLNRLESGKHDPTFGTVTRLARALGVKLTAFLGAEEGG